LIYLGLSGNTILFVFAQVFACVSCLCVCICVCFASLCVCVSVCVWCVCVCVCESCVYRNLYHFDVKEETLHPLSQCFDYCGDVLHHMVCLWSPPYSLPQLSVSLSAPYCRGVTLSV